jgi:hypothetical protein
LQGGALSQRGGDAQNFSPKKETRVGIYGMPKRELPPGVIEKFSPYVVKAYLVTDRLNCNKRFKNINYFLRVDT